jgi:hypothetical protein
MPVRLRILYNLFVPPPQLDYTHIVPLPQVKIHPDDSHYECLMIQMLSRNHRRRQAHCQIRIPKCPHVGHILLLMVQGSHHWVGRFDLQALIAT